MTIEVATTEQLVEITAGLVKQGLTFRAFPDKTPGHWTIILTGGF